MITIYCGPLIRHRNGTRASRLRHTIIAHFRNWLLVSDQESLITNLRNWLCVRLERQFMLMMRKLSTLVSRPHPSCVCLHCFIVLRFFLSFLSSVCFYGFIVLRFLSFLSSVCFHCFIVLRFFVFFEFSMFSLFHCLTVFFVFFF